MEFENYMQEALFEAEKALALNEVPVGCVIVKGGEIIARGFNTRERDQNALMHAEMIAIDNACKKLNDWRLTGCTLYVTLEPCPMCAGAIINARLDRVVYGASDTRFGACGGVMNLFLEAFGFTPSLYGGVLKAECAQLLSRFFQSLR